MIKEYLESRRIKRKVKQHLKGYKYACGCLISKSKTIEQLQSEVDVSILLYKKSAFDCGMEDAIEDLRFYCNFEEFFKN
jgi:hypothetical protein